MAVSQLNQLHVEHIERHNVEKESEREFALLM